MKKQPELDKNGRRIVVLNDSFEGNVKPSDIFKSVNIAQFSPKSSMKTLI